MNLTKEDKDGLKIFTFVSSVFLLLATCALYILNNADKYDSETLCPTEDSYLTVDVLVDKTDPWHKERSERLEKLMRQIKSALNVHERMTIYVLDETGNDILTPVFDMCNPGRGDQVSPLFSNPRKVQAKFDEQFNTPLEKMLADLLKPGKALQSPILETINNFPQTSREKKLILVSDLMENTNQISFYRNDVRVDDISEVKMCQPSKHIYSYVSVFFIDRQQVSLERKKDVFTFWSKCLSGISKDVKFSKI